MAMHWLLVKSSTQSIIKSYHLPTPFSTTTSRYHASHLHPPSHLPISHAPFPLAPYSRPQYLTKCQTSRHKRHNQPHQIQPGPPPRPILGLLQLGGTNPLVPQPINPRIDRLHVHRAVHDCNQVTSRTNRVQPPIPRCCSSSSPRRVSVGDTRREGRGGEGAVGGEGVPEDAEGRDGAEEDVADGPEDGPLAAEVACCGRVGGGGGRWEVD